MLALIYHIVVCNTAQRSPYLIIISNALKVRILENFQYAGKETHAGETLAGINLESTGIPILFRSLISIIGMGPRTKQCPFCENTLPMKTCICQFCNKILMREIHLGLPRKDYGRIPK